MMDLFDFLLKNETPCWRGLFIQSFYDGILNFSYLDFMKNNYFIKKIEMI